MSNAQVKSPKSAIKLAVSLLFLLAALSPAAEPPKWLKFYPQRQYGAFWHFEFEIQNLSKKKDEILSILINCGGEPTIPPSNMASSKTGDYQQLSYRFQRKDAEKALTKLNKIGKVKNSNQHDNYDTITERDTREKIVRLKTEMSAESAALKRMPAVSQLAAEMVETLQTSASAYQRSENVILLNLVLQEKAK